MKCNQLVWLFAGISFAVCSCRKENNSKQPVENPIYLIKYVAFSSFNTSTTPSIVMDYYYDSLDRLQAIVTNLNPPPGGAVIEYPDSLMYYYNAADTLPFKAIHYNRGTLTPAEYYTYDDQARIIKWKYFTAFSSFEDDYTYFPNQIIVTHSYATPNDTLTYDGNNITEDGKRFSIQASGVHNPFDLVSINRHILYTVPFPGTGERALNKNAPLQVMDNYYANNINYQYDSIINGFPRRATTTFNSSPNSRQYFYYRQ